MLVVRSVRQVHRLRHQQVLLLLGLVAVVVHVHSAVLGVGLPHHLIVVYALVDQAGEVRLELLLQKHHVLVNGGHILLVGRILTAHSVHVVHRWVEAADVVQRAYMHHHILVQPVYSHVLTLH